jgi:hypothetical protein
MDLAKMLLVVNPATVCREANSSRDQLTSEMTTEAGTIGTSWMSTAVRPPESDGVKASNIREASIIQERQQQQQESTTRT